MEAVEIIVPVITAISGATVGIVGSSLTSRSKNKEVVLVHYDKIVDQLQEEVTNLRHENDGLRRQNLEFERRMLEMNQHVLTLTAELNALREFVSKNIGKST